MSITEQALRESVAGGYRMLKDIGSDFGVTAQRIQQLCAKYGIERPRAFDEYARSTQFAYAKRSRWPREGIPALKRRLGLCQWNGCFSMQATNRVRCPQHLRLLAAHVKRHHNNHRDSGLCIHCSQPVALGHTRCQRHLDELRGYSHRYYHAHKAAA